VERVPISKLRARFLDFLERVKRTGEPILVTRHGEPLAQILPPPISERPTSWLGALQGTGKIVGDILSPATNEQEWEVLQK
jgi:prevent-host-death family protein